MAYGHGWTIHSHCPTKCHHFVNFLLVARWTTSGLPSSVSALIPLIRMRSNEPVNIIYMLSFQGSLHPAIAPGGGCPYARDYGRLCWSRLLFGGCQWEVLFPFDMYIIAYIDLFCNRSIYKKINKNRSAYLCNLTRLTRHDIMAIERVEHYEN